jgi:hypothetical protein
MAGLSIPDSKKPPHPLVLRLSPLLEGSCYQIRDGQGDLRINGYFELRREAPFYLELAS